MVDPSPADLSHLAARLIAGLSERGETIATAESLTGGLIGATITGVPGASASFRGGVISYATDLKAELAGVEMRILTEHGAVSAATAAAMASGVATRCAADWGIAVTGVAGPGPQEGHPPGTVYCAAARQPRQTQGSSNPSAEREYRFAGDRSQVRVATVRAALTLALKAV